MYAQLSDSFMWNHLNKDNSVLDIVSTALKEGQQITLDKMPMAVSVLKNRIKSPIMTALLDEIEKGGIVLVYAPSLRIPLYLPFILSASGNTCTGIVFVNNCDAQMGRDELKLDERKLKVSLESCYLAKKMFYMANSPKLISSQILRTSASIYSHVITECINRKHSIKLDQDIFNKITYLNTRFFIGTVMGYHPEPDMMERYCLYDCMNADLISIRRTVDKYTEENFKDISAYIQSIATDDDLKGRTGKLTVSNFTESFINMYDAAMLLSVEVFPYFVYNVISVNEATYVNNYHSLKNIVGDDGKKLYAALISSLCI